MLAGPHVPGDRKMMEAAPNSNYAHVCRNIIPQMLKAGVSRKKSIHLRLIIHARISATKNEIASV